MGPAIDINVVDDTGGNIACTRESEHGEMAQTREERSSIRFSSRIITPYYGRSLSAFFRSFVLSCIVIINFFVIKRAFVRVRACVNRTYYPTAEDNNRAG